jgi:lysylphosphatidylglycerol synthetase-like protein (DUF2156 family)
MNQPTMPTSTDTTRGLASWLPSAAAIHVALHALRDRAWRQPFTVTLIGVLLLVAWASGSLTHSVADTALLNDIGYGVPALRQGQFYTIFTSIAFALFPWMLATVIFLVLIGVLPFEMVAGWRRTAIVFAITQVGGYILASLLVAWPLAATGSDWGAHLANTRDVGPSAGAFGCLSALAWYLPHPWRRRGIVALLVYFGGFLLLTHRIWDVEHAIAGLLGLALGWLLIERGMTIRQALRAAWFTLRPHPRDVIATLVVLAGLMNILSALGTDATSRVATWDTEIPFVFLHGTRTFVALSGLALILLGRGLRQGRRVAWATTIALLVGSVISHIIKGLDVEEAVLEVALLAGLVWRRHDFIARPDVPTVARAVRLSAFTLALLPVYVVAGLLVLHGQFDRPVTLPLAAREVAWRMLASTTHQFNGTTFETRWFLDSITFVWAGILLICAIALLRPVLHPTEETSSDRRDALDLLHAFGDSTVAHMTIWPGNTLLLNHHHDAYVAYRLIGDVALALGDPVGMPAGSASAIHEFTTLARRNGWTPCFYGVGRQHRDDYARNGLATMQVGEDAFIDLATLSLSGKQWQDVRTAINKAEKQGIAFHLIDQSSVDPAIVRQLHDISDAWVRAKGLPEMGFTLGTLSDPPDPEVRTAIAIDREGIVHGFLTWLPVYAAGGWVIDIMRRRPDAFKGVMEYLIIQSALAFRDEGAPFISLATAPLARVAREGDCSGTIERAIAGLAGLIEPFYQTRSLFEFKRKFQPRWEPVYLAYPGATNLPKIGYAILRAYLPTLGVDQIRSLISRPRATPRPAAPSQGPPSPVGAG